MSDLLHRYDFFLGHYLKGKLKRKIKKEFVDFNKVLVLKNNIFEKEFLINWKMLKGKALQNGLKVAKCVSTMSM